MQEKKSTMRFRSGIPLFGALCGLVVLLSGIDPGRSGVTAAPPPPPRDVHAAQAPAAAGTYIVLGWNDLGMHCYNFDFSDLGVLPPFNNLWVQVLRVSDPPQIITSGITVSYSFPDNTYSVGKSNFWTHAQDLFGLPQPLPPNIGLTGRGLAGTMDAAGDHYVAEGIPLTEFSDSAPTVPDPYQLAEIVVRDGSGTRIASNTVVAPVSTEMHCDNCHTDNGRGNPGIATGKVDRNILTVHDAREHTNLMGQRPVLCASCHASNALGTPGAPGVPNLSKAMHGKHQRVVPSTLSGCYSCHPGPNTKCLRDVMFAEEGITCVRCHGDLRRVSQNPNPWLNEPRCDTCHENVRQDHALYRLSKGHGGLYCAACHDSPHAIAPSLEPRDSIKFVNLQGRRGPLRVCTTCHATQPSGPGPHGEDGEGGDDEEEDD